MNPIGAFDACLDGSLQLLDKQLDAVVAQFVASLDVFLSPLFAQEWQLEVSGQQVLLYVDGTSGGRIFGRVTLFLGFFELDVDFGPPLLETFLHVFDLLDDVWLVR